MSSRPAEVAPENLVQTGSWIDRSLPFLPDRATNREIEREKICVQVQYSITMYSAFVDCSSLYMQRLFHLDPARPFQLYIQPLNRLSVIDRDKFRRDLYASSH